MSKVHFITYGSHEYEETLKRIEEEATNSNFFDSIKIYHGQDSLTKGFKEKHKLILKERRGGGFWIWKLDVIMQRLNEIDENDILIYCDAGHSINKNGKEQLDMYIESLMKSEYGIISFQWHGDTDRRWITNEMMNYFKLDVNNPHVLSGPMCANTLIMKKCDHLKKILKIYEKLMDDNVYLISDVYNSNKQHSTYNETRHDQSAFGLIRKIHGSLVFKDNTWAPNFGKNTPPFIKNEPFWATRERLDKTRDKDYIQKNKESSKKLKKYLMDNNMI